MAPRLPPELEPDFLLAAYAAGYFPMDDGADDDGEVRWYDPDPRAILPVGGLHVSRSLGRVLRQKRYEVRINLAFEEVVRRCARPRDPADGVWISERFVRAYCELARRGFALSFEGYRDGELVAGLYGVSIGNAFMAESMFHVAPDAGNVVLATAAGFLFRRGVELFDVQFSTEHLAGLGVVEIPRAEYHRRLARAVDPVS